ncbi:putative MCH1 [Coleophoma crateriformis]|uniref:Probable transporter MCH1 n=1 Tax=Coleophoma crateriformis TaxID=565419 RepID=A0A3D8RDL1_9HELO|nr:putative MCH1 [Coleophoma crateriformis]
MASEREPLLIPPIPETSSLPSSPTSTSMSSIDRRMQNRSRDVIRYISFASAILSCLCAGSITAYSLYGHLFQERLRYTQLEVNYVVIAAELAMYLLVPLFGYICDRIGPASLSFASAIMFATGYLLAALTYRSGASPITGLTYQRGWPIWVMILSFTIIGAATTCMYISAVTTCAKNFGRGKYAGLALACPIASFGLSGMWQSQVASRILYERHHDGTRGDVDVFKFFIFLAVTLLAVGLLGTVLLKVVDEEELIDEAVEELERSGLLEDSEFFRRGRGYGTIETGEHDEEEAQQAEDAKALEEEEARKKTWLLNDETRRFLKDHTMWWLAGGFFFISGPGEAFITNLGTIIGTLYPPSADVTRNTSAATHVSIVALTSTIARVLLGTLTDVLAPAPASHHQQYVSAANSSAPLPPQRRFTVSRVTFLLGSGVMLFLGQVLLASGLIQNHGERFWLVSSLIGSGYGALFSLTPLIISVIWGVENFGTNWGIVAMVPAVGATVWGVIYSSVYQWAAENYPLFHRMAGEPDEVLCYGKQCYEITFWSMAASVAFGCALWIWAWKGPHGWSARGISV